jgi:hypothetical protein
LVQSGSGRGQGGSVVVVVVYGSVEVMMVGKWKMMSVRVGQRVVKIERLAGDFILLEVAAAFDV